MRPVKIVTDSTCDLNEEDIKRLDIAVMPLHVTFKEKSYDDGVNLTVDELYKMVDENKMLPKTAAITIMEFIDEFKKWIDNGYDVIYTGISQAMSSTLNNAVLAISELGAEENAMAVDSKNLSTGIGLIVLKAAALAKEGKSLKEVACAIEDVRERVRSQFYIDTFDYLHKGGRCSSMAKIFGSMLKIKPLVSVIDGRMSVTQKPHGRVKARRALLDLILNDKDNLDLEYVMVTHSKADEDAVILKNALHEMGIENVVETHAGCVISSHCGPGTIGILYILKNLK